MARAWVTNFGGGSILGALAALLFISSSLRAGTIRDDRDPQLYLDRANAPGLAGVGRLDVKTSSTEFIGSGTLIAPQWVLTVNHVLSGARTVDFALGDRSFSADRWVQNPNYDGNFRRGFDIALVRLAEPVTDVAPATLYRGHKEFGATGTFAGFGLTGTGSAGATVDDRMKRAGTNVIDGLIRAGKGDRADFRQKFGLPARTFAVDFDNPADPADNVFGSPEPTDLEFLISHGDSGGPVFIDVGAGPQLAGLHSFGEFLDDADDSGYGDVTGHTRVSKFIRWINKTMRKNEPDALPTTLGVEPLSAAGRSLAVPRGADANIPEPSGMGLFGLVLLCAAFRQRQCGKRRPGS